MFFLQFLEFDDFNYFGEGSRETVNLMHLNLLIIGILFHSSQFLDFLCAFDRSFGWMAANPVDFGEPLYPTAILFTNLWRLEGEIRSKSCLIIGFAVVKVARKKHVIVEMIIILVYMLVKTWLLFWELICLLFELFVTVLLLNCWKWVLLDCYYTNMVEFPFHFPEVSKTVLLFVNTY